ncbi:kinase-like protein [Rhizoclosmatium globosum]|uniref:Kinase-like protein n=1 Tax=Rhizoclosmatium globosum TaxID=329046 RepID=A0A1Y2BS74_9FUNG|nr:kinase-like protein [Rhizoclosmatium globosum]|eukprot:ORY37590.1 kinase-like protein [Rhizoclosmatium globosum]
MPRSKSRDSNHFSIKSASRQDSQHRQTLSRSTSARTRKERHEVIESSFVYEKHDQYSLSPLLKQNEDDNLEGKINQYLILREIGSGAYGKVNLCKSENDRRYYACKVVSKSKLKKKFRWNCTPMLGPRSMVTEKEVDPIQNIRREVAILKKLSKHPNINALVEVLDDENDDNLYMFFELCEYGPVMVIKIHERPRPFSESLARVYFRDVLLGIEYLHKNRIIHRDIKPENLLLTLEQTIQIADFGISHMFNEGEDDRIVDKNTSPLFCPPEACQSNGSSTIIKGFPFDVWSMGVTLFCFVHGYCPFEDECIPDLYSKICQDEPRLSRDLSPELTALLSDMLNKDPEQRATLKQIRDHSWVTDNGTEPLISEEENCILEVSVTDEDIENAVSPGRKLINQVYTYYTKNILKIILYER